MRFSDLSRDLEELAPVSMTATTTPTATTATGATTMAPGQSVQADPQAQAKMMAQQALDRANKKKEIQELIKAKQEELADLQKQLATIK